MKCLIRYLSPITLLVLGSTSVLLTVAEAAAIDPKSFASKVWKKARRVANLQSTFGSATHSKTPYERVMGHSVFQVTTPSGASYLSFERSGSQDQKIESTGIFDLTGGLGMGSRRTVNAGMDSSSTKTVTVFYMDPADALNMRQQMKAIPSLKDADLRITASSFAKALRQSANFEDGLPTGRPVDSHSGEIPGEKEGGFLRYKIAPSARELFYAIRCKGRHRVGLVGPPGEDAKNVASGLGNLISVSPEKDKDDGKDKKGDESKEKTEEKEPKLPKDYNAVGVPVFYTPMLQRRLPLVKQLTSGVKKEKPFFMSYEDLVESWDTLRKKHPSMPKIPDVEVFNLVDVLTSMDVEQNTKAKVPLLDWKDPIGSIKGSIKKRFSGGSDEETLQDITFIPPSYAARYKEKMRAKGNGKARLRPMR